MNESLDELLNRSRRVHQAQQSQMAAAAEVPRPGFVDRVIQARSTSVDGSLERLVQVAHAAGWGLVLSALAVLMLWGLPPSASFRSARIQAAADVWSSIAAADPITWEDFE